MAKQNNRQQDLAEGEYQQNMQPTGHRPQNCQLAGYFG